MKMNRHLIMVLATGAGLVASVVLAFKAGMKAEEILKEEDPDGELNILQKAKRVAPTVLPAAGAMALTGAGLVAEFTGREKEFKAAERTIKKLGDSKDRIKKDFEGYRETLAKTDGKEKDVEIVQKTAASGIDDDDETTHIFQIDWFGDDKPPIRFEASYKTLYDGLNNMNKYIVDDINRDRDYATVSDMFIGMKMPGLIDNDTDDAGWSAPVMVSPACEAYWITFTFVELEEAGNPNPVIDIIPNVYPNFNVEQYVDELAARGEI